MLLVPTNSQFRYVVQHLMLAVFIAASQTTTLRAQTNAPPKNDTAWQLQYDLFQMLLEEKGLKVLDEYETALRRPSDSVIVLMGSIPRQLSNDAWDRLYEFVREGGAALITSDTQFTSPSFGTFIAGPVRNRNPMYQYQGFEDCVLAGTTEEGQQLMPGVTTLVTNRSGWFAQENVNEIFWDPLVVLPDDCEPFRAQGQPLLVRGTIDQRGVVIVSADASLFSNGMMWHGDNAVASIRIAEMLCEGGRKNLAFLKDSQFLSSYRDRITAKIPDVPAPELPEPTMDKFLRLSNAVLKEVAESNVMNEALREQPRHWSPNTYFLLLLNLAVATFLILLARMLWRNGTLPNRFLGRQPMKTAYQMRCETGGRRGDYRNAAGYLAREFCWEITGSRRSADWQAALQGFTQVSKQTRRKLTSIIDIASRGRQVRMNRDEFEQLGSTILELSAELMPPKVAKS